LAGRKVVASFPRSPDVIAQQFTWQAVSGPFQQERASRFLLLAIQQRICSRASILTMLRTIAEHDSQYF
jgi:hypothetical protein